MKLGSSLFFVCVCFCCYLFCHVLLFLCSTDNLERSVFNKLVKLICFTEDKTNSDLAAIPLRGRHLAPSCAVLARTYVKCYYTNRKPIMSNSICKFYVGCIILSLKFWYFESENKLFLTASYSAGWSLPLQTAGVWYLVVEGLPRSPLSTLFEVLSYCRRLVRAAK